MIKENKHFEGETYAITSTEKSKVKYVKFYNETSESGSILDRDDFCAPKVLYHLTGIKIYQDWNLPPMKSLNKYWKKLPSWKFLEENKNHPLFDEFVELNPELKIFNQHNQYDKQNVICGVLSKFNLDDIVYYIVVSMKDRPNFIIEYQRKLEKMIGYGFQWICSPNTLEEIEKQYKQINS